MRLFCNLSVAAVLLCLAVAVFLMAKKNHFQFSIRSVLLATAFVAFAVVAFQKVGLVPWGLGWASVGGALGALTRSIWLGVCAAVCLVISSFVILVCNVSVWF